MEKTFQKNAKKPGDEGFQYDKQEYFNPNKQNEWDEELED